MRPYCNRAPIPSCLTSLLILLLGFLSVRAADEVQIKNRTIERTIQLRTHSLFAPYIDLDLQNRWWDFGADAYVNTNKYVRLTRPVPSQMGWLWSRLPITSPNYAIEVEFKVSGESTTLFGDGLAIWLTTDRAKPGPVFGNADKFEGLGVFLDTYANARHSYTFPRINAMLGDGATVYDYGNDGDSTSLGACSVNFRRTNVATKLKITYFKDNFLDVKIQYKAWDEWSDCFSVEKVTLPSAPFLGFSAMTGDVFDAHDIISVTTYSAILSSPENPRNKMKAGAFGSKAPPSKGSWLGFTFKVLLFVGICAGVYFGYQKHLGRSGRGRGLGGGGGLGSGFYSNGKRF